MADQNRGKENEANKSEIVNDDEFEAELLNPGDWEQQGLDTDLQKLYRAAMHGKWETAKAIIRKNPDARKKRISPLGYTALHVAASCGRSEFVVELVKLLTAEELEIKDQVGRTALHHASLAASVRAAKAMVEKNPYLPQLGDMNSHIPLIYAAQWRHPSKSKKMLEYLHQVTEDKHLFDAFRSGSSSNLIVTITASGSYDIALSILDRYPGLAYEKNNEGMSILHVLATQPSAFRSGIKLSLWNLLMYHFVDKEVTVHQQKHLPDDEANINVIERIKRASAASVHKLSNFIKGKKASEIVQRHLLAVKLVEFVCKQLQMKTITVIQDFFIPKDGTAILHLAIQHGVSELVQICLEYFPDLIWYTNNKKRLLLHMAIEHRRVDTFNHIIYLIGKNTKAYAEFEVDDEHNNSLHLAAKLAPQPQLQSVPGPAFQMQREIQWFKAVDALVYYKSRTAKNKDEKTPQELFIEKHETLLKDAKEWMKDTSNSSMVVAALVATVAFAAMITVPGGNDTWGMPVLSRKKLFIVFYVSNALSMTASAISLLMFLSVQTSRFTDEDFLDSLPKILRRGLTFLFIAVATMMISFGTTIGLSLQQRIFNWAYILIAVVASCPVIFFYKLQLPLISQMLLFTSGPDIYQGQRDWKFWSLNKSGYRLLANDEP